MPRPYHSTTRAAAAEETHRRIVAAAAALLREKGAAAFTLEGVARKAGVARLTVYNRFGSRRALLEAVFDGKAAEGGLYRLREAMAHDDARTGLWRLIDIFCAFWSFDRETLVSLYGAASGDAELEASLRARNARRREAIAVLIARVAERDEIGANARDDLGDLIFVLTSFPVYAGLTEDGRSCEDACALIQAMVDDAIRRASSG